MGVWIETTKSQPFSKNPRVTPCVGVWIETWRMMILMRKLSVTPCVGVWIETYTELQRVHLEHSHTLRGCVDWNNAGTACIPSWSVTPCVGVWIETLTEIINFCIIVSHPAWVCGLKLSDLPCLYTPVYSHTLRGCVDWNLFVSTTKFWYCLSLPAWVCGLNLVCSQWR